MGTAQDWSRKNAEIERGRSRLAIASCGRTIQPVSCDNALASAIIKAPLTIERRTMCSKIASDPVFYQLPVMPVQIQDTARTKVNASRYGAKKSAQFNLLHSITFCPQSRDQPINLLPIARLALNLGCQPFGRKRCKDALMPYL